MTANELPEAAARGSTDAIRRRMRTAGVTQRQLAKAIGISRSTMRRRLNGEREMRAADVLKIARFLEVPLTDLIPDEGQP
ncbi:helix-turn-helix domain-containing protein [Rhodococcus daqingensis]|uniref:Helix-turn-helix domain-containing protein n=1 Tax=Rhodococcus daqingensis TaxID=2479363 RepID=A0ABW2S4M8_9NOCA